ncbi:MAG: sugar transferase, partial [Anaerolineales bacterium]|nr:sugar transferase [Anaerolineales bacterium]
MELRYIETPQVRLYKKEYQLIKRAFDLTICMIALPPLLLLMGVIALLIYMDDPGPVLFKQQRTGKGGKRFGIYKFRTMV